MNPISYTSPVDLDSKSSLKVEDPQHPQIIPPQVREDILYINWLAKSMKSYSTIPSHRTHKRSASPSVIVNGPEKKIKSCPDLRDDSENFAEIEFLPIEPTALSGHSNLESKSCLSLRDLLETNHFWEYDSISYFTDSATYPVSEKDLLCRIHWADSIWSYDDLPFDWQVLIKAAFQRGNDDTMTELSLIGEEIQAEISSVYDAHCWPTEFFDIGSHSYTDVAYTVSWAPTSEGFTDLNEEVQMEERESLRARGILS